MTLHVWKHFEHNNPHVSIPIIQWLIVGMIHGLVPWFSNELVQMWILCQRDVVLMFSLKEKKNDKIILTSCEIRGTRMTGIYLKKFMKYAYMDTHHSWR